jgi:hypothetical protein
MEPLSTELRAELLALAAEDRRVRSELAATGELLAMGYHPRMEKVHREHAARLRAILAEHGWPDEELVGAEDRIRFFEGRPQRCGTQFDWDESGQLNPVPAIEEPEKVDARRRAVGLGPLVEAVRRHREAATAAKERPPADLAARHREMAAWAPRVGWSD